MKNPFPVRRTGEHFHSGQVKLQTENPCTGIPLPQDKSVRRTDKSVFRCVAYGNLGNLQLDF